MTFAGVHFTQAARRMVDSRTMAPPVAVIDALNSLLEAELGSVFRFYVDRWGKYGETYGAVGGVIILLFLFYLDALILLIGAEINSEVDCALRSASCEREKPPPPAETVDTEPVTETP